MEGIRNEEDAHLQRTWPSKLWKDVFKEVSCTTLALAMLMLIVICMTVREMITTKSYVAHMLKRHASSVLSDQEMKTTLTTNSEGKPILEVTCTISVMYCKNNMNDQGGY